MIKEFQGRYRFLSNFYGYPVLLDGVIYPTAEHAYQAAKTYYPEQRDRIRAAKTPGIAKRLGKGVTLRSDWEAVKLDVMLKVLRAKFNGPPLSNALIETGTQELVEGNYWHDTFWGVCGGYGLNHLGRLLMQVRQELQQ